MAGPGPEPILPTEHAQRLRRVRKIARHFGFVGRCEYRHVHSGSGGAQFGLAAEAELDLLVVYAEAFERDADPEDFSLEAMISHECGHQIVGRNRELQRFLIGKTAPATEEILASLVGSWLAETDRDRQDLVLKALDEAVGCGLALTDAVKMIAELRGLLEDMS